MSLILAWAHAFHRRHGSWPQRRSGPVTGQGSETWQRIDTALNGGWRGLPGGSSLKRFLVDRKLVGPETVPWRPALTLEQIWEWAQSFHEQHGNWPGTASGPIARSDGDTWTKVDIALTRGLRGLPGGSSLARFLASRGAVRQRASSFPITTQQLLAWADAFFEEHGVWPYRDSGRIRGSDGKTWQYVDSILRDGRRGQPGGASLSAFLSEHRPVEMVNGRRRYRHSKARLSLGQIRRWAAGHRNRTGRWPPANAGRIRSQGDRGLTWKIVDNALRAGCRGLPGGSSLRQLFGRKIRSKTAARGRRRR